jgi:hypothetical protein
MPVLTFGNASVVESYKPDPGVNATELQARKDLGRQVTTMHLNEVDGEDRPSRAMNLSMAGRLWSQHSDRPPAWVESDDELLAALVADDLGCPVGRPKTWKMG